MAEADQPTIYLDYAATTPVDPAVADAMCECLTLEGTYGNPTSGHTPGRCARAAVENARRDVAALIGADPREVVFTSGATESINTAVIGGARFAAEHAERGRHIVTSRIEHKATLASAQQLEREGFEVSWLEPDADGLISPEAVAEALRDDTALVSLMHVNNELGTLTDIRACAAVAHERGALFHVDAAQSAGKLPVDVRELDVDMLSLSAHKLYGPKGAGALYLRRQPRVRIEPLMQGGGQESGVRAGTLATHQIVGLGLACSLAGEHLEVEMERIGGLRERLVSGLMELGGVHLNGHPTQRAPGIANLSFEDVDGECLLFALYDLAVSAGSACSSTDRAPSYVLSALGRDDALARASLRISVGRYTRDQDVDRAVARIAEEVGRLRVVAGRISGATA